MAKINAMNGIFTIGGKDAGEIRNFNYDENFGLNENETLNNLVPDVLQSNYGFTANAEFWFDSADQGQVLIATPADGKAPEVSLVLYPDGKGSGKIKLTGTATVESKSISFERGNYVGMNVTLKGTSVLVQGTQ